MISYALGGLALYTVIFHAYAWMRMHDNRARIARMEAIFRQMGVVFTEDQPSAFTGDRSRPPPVEGDDL